MADALEPLWPERAAALRECEKGGVQLDCKACSAPHLVPFRCGARTCPTCARMGAAALASRIARRIVVHDHFMESEPWEGAGARQQRSWRHLVLTTPAAPIIEDRFDPDKLRAQVRRARSALPRFWRSTPWGRQVRRDGSHGKRARHDTSYALAEEIAPGGMVHIHMLVYGEYVDQKLLQHAWTVALGEQAILHVKSVRGPSGVAGALREVLKYATKGEKGARTQTKHAASVEVALRNVHRVSVGGALRGIRVEESDGATDDVQPEDLHARQILSCEVCGTVGEWKWVQTRTAKDVEELGGFGLIASRSAIERLWAG